MYLIGGILLLLMIGSFGVGNDGTDAAPSTYQTGIGVHAVNYQASDNELSGLVATGVLAEVDKQTSANGIRR